MSSDPPKLSVLTDDQVVGDIVFTKVGSPNESEWSLVEPDITSPRPGRRAGLYPVVHGHSDRRLDTREKWVRPLPEAIQRVGTGCLHVQAGGLSPLPLRRVLFHRKKLSPIPNRETGLLPPGSPVCLEPGAAGRPRRTRSEQDVLFRPRRGPVEGLESVHIQGAGQYRHQMPGKNCFPRFQSRSRDRA